MEQCLQTSFFEKVGQREYLLLNGIGYNTKLITKGEVHCLALMLAIIGISIKIDEREEMER